MLLFELLPPFPLYNKFSLDKIPDKDKEFGGNKLSANKEVMRFYAEFVSIDEITKQIYAKTVIMQKYFNHPNRSFQFGGDNAKPGSVIYLEVSIFTNLSFVCER